MQAKQFLCVSAIAAAAGVPASILAQWAPTHSIERTGLFGPEQTGSAGLQTSTALLLDAGFAAGTSVRYTGVSTTNGQDAWAWTGTTTVRLGLPAAVYTGSAGYRNTTISLLTFPGPVVGLSSRYIGVNTPSGQDTWVWNGTTTTQIGLTGGVYAGSTGVQSSEPRVKNSAGHVAGSSSRYGPSGSLGRAAWVWNGTTTTQIGFTSAPYTGLGGLQFSEPHHLSAAGQVTGRSLRYNGASTTFNQDAWVWNGTTTTQIGLTGGAYSGSDGSRSSSPVLQNAAGQVAGQSYRYLGENTLNGQDAWVWNGTTTTQIGLTGPGYTGSQGAGSSSPGIQNEAGRIVGWSNVVSGVNTILGRHAWIWNGTTTTQIGLTGGVYTGSGGYRYSLGNRINGASQVLGYSYRSPAGEFANNGTDAWIWNGTATVQIGLTGGPYIGSGGRQYGIGYFLTESGQVAGISHRYTGVDTANGTDVWVWNGATTTRINLAGGVYTGSSGYQSSDLRFQNASGKVVGFSHRITGAGTQNGQDAWYFDPVTGVTSAIIASVRTSDGRAFSEPTILTDDGYMLGNYTFYAGGVGDGEQRAFVYRPDRGLSDLGALVNGGLAARGWRTLKSPHFSDSVSTIVGHGFVSGQLDGQSVFVMKPGTAPTCPADFGGPGGVPGPDGLLDNNDFIAFINYFFTSNPLADVGRSGGVPGSDGLFDNNDFIVFINQFFAGC